MSLDLLSQIWIGVFGVGVIFLIGIKNPQYRRFGYVAGLIGQPAWVYATYTAEQWPILALTAVYTFSWANGLRNNWRTQKGADKDL